jgi:two-component system, sensor histidine kinase and response regulator
MMNAYAGLLEDRYETLLDDKGRKYINLITSNATRMQKMIQDILTFSRVGREEIGIETVDCNQVVDEVIGELAQAIAEKGAIIRRGELPVLRTSHTLIRVLFQNLVGNALKFQDGSRTPQISIAAERQETIWRFEVRDNGIGIDPAFGDRIFAIFQRIHRKEDYPGTGIGLSTCRKFIKLCGGDIHFESTPGEGTAFIFTIPQ